MATIIVEDGTIVSGANSYISVADLDTYVGDRGVTLTAATDAAKGQLIIRSMDYLESLLYIGIKTTITQGLQFPRTNMIVDYFLLAADEIPQLLIDAQAEVIVAIDRDESPLKDLERKTIKEKVDTLEVQYSVGSSTNTVVRTINVKLYKLLVNSGSNFRITR